MNEVHNRRAEMRMLRLPNASNKCKEIKKKEVKNYVLPLDTLASRIIAVDKLVWRTK